MSSDYVSVYERERVARGEELLQAIKDALRVDEASQGQEPRPPHYREAMMSLFGAFDSHVRDVLSEERVVTRGMYD